MSQSDCLFAVGCASWAHNILTTVMTIIVFDKSKDHAKALPICSSTMEWYSTLKPIWIPVRVEEK